MANEQITPGYEWSEVSREKLAGQAAAAEPFDLRRLYPLDAESLQAAWDGRRETVLDTSGGTRIASTTFNPGSEGGTIFWLPGWGTSNRHGRGARAATAIAALNPDKKVLAAEELVGVPEEHRRYAAEGDMEAYAYNYMLLLDAQDQVPDSLSGHSRGGIIQVHLAAHPAMAGLGIINLMDMPRARAYPTALELAVRIGYLDNLLPRQYMHLSSAGEERLLEDIIPDEPDVRSDKLHDIGRGIRQWWLIRSMAKAGLKNLAAEMLASQPDAEIYWWQGNRSIGAPPGPVRRLVRKLWDELPEEQAEKLHYFESPTGHFTEGHVARCGRQTAYAIEHTDADA